jgi:hypothetical protein
MRVAKIRFGKRKLSGISQPMYDSLQIDAVSRWKRGQGGDLEAAEGSVHGQVRSRLVELPSRFGMKVWPANSGLSKFGISSHDF